MIRLLKQLPRHVNVACSGGIDSMVALDFLCKGKRDVTVVHFDHGTLHSEHARKFVEDYCRLHDLKLIIGDLAVITHKIIN